MSPRSFLKGTFRNVLEGFQFFSEPSLVLFHNLQASNWSITWMRCITLFLSVGEQS